MALFHACSLGSQSNACHFYLQQEWVVLNRGSEPPPAAGLLRRRSPCSVISPLIVIWLLRARAGDGAPTPGADGARPPAALPSPCTHGHEEHEGIMTERLVAADEDNDYNGNDYSRFSQIPQLQCSFYARFLGDQRIGKIAGYSSAYA